MKQTSIETAINFIQGIKELVEKSVSMNNSIYWMDDYRNCILGVHLHEGKYWEKKQIETVEKILGISKVELEERIKPDSDVCWFHHQKNLYSNEEWIAIRIFTSNITKNASETIFGSEWIVFADHALKELNELLENQK